MDEKTYSITLADGTVLDNLSMNGNNFIFVGVLTEDTFSGNLSPVVISDGENTETHENMDLVACNTTYDPGKTWFVLRDYSDDELAQIQMRSDIEYLAMMTGIEL